MNKQQEERARRQQFEFYEEADIVEYLKICFRDHDHLRKADKGFYEGMRKSDYGHLLDLAFAETNPEVKAFKYPKTLTTFLKKLILLRMAADGKPKPTGSEWLAKELKAFTTEPRSKRTFKMTAKKTITRG